METIVTIAGLVVSIVALLFAFVAAVKGTEVRLWWVTRKRRGIEERIKRELDRLSQISVLQGNIYYAVELGVTTIVWGFAAWIFGASKISLIVIGLSLGSFLGYFNVATSVLALCISLYSITKVMKCLIHLRELAAPQTTAFIVKAKLAQASQKYKVAGKEIDKLRLSLGEQLDLDIK